MSGDLTRDFIHQYGDYRLLTKLKTEPVTQSEVAERVQLLKTLVELGQRDPITPPRDPWGNLLIRDQPRITLQRWVSLGPDGKRSRDDIALGATAVHYSVDTKTTISGYLRSSAAALNHAPSHN